PASARFAGMIALGTLLALAPGLASSWSRAPAPDAAVPVRPALQPPPTQEERRRVRKSLAEGEAASIGARAQALVAAPLLFDADRYTISLQITLPGPGSGRVD